MNTRQLAILFIVSFFYQTLQGQDQGFFLNDWKPATIAYPQHIVVQGTTDPVHASFTVQFHDTITRVPDYVFGDNANLWTGTMSDNPLLMKRMSDRRMGVLRGPGGSISDMFFWNRSASQRPADIPDRLAGTTEPFEPWYGVRPHPWENWTMATDSFYRILKHTNVTGMITVNYGYARYGTSQNPVSRAAKLAADWVRYDRGRSKFWEIGNENYGSWEAGYRIDTSLNKDGQPEFINGTLYGQHARVFIDSMRAAAAETGATIKIGLVLVDEPNAMFGNWNNEVLAAAADVADFYVVHSYYTPWQQNSNLETVLNSYKKTGFFKEYVWGQATQLGKPRLPVALTEYNIFAIGSNQAVSHANGMHAVLVTGEAIKTGYGAALRWDLANGWDNGNDHGMFSYGNEPGVERYAPRPAFYHMYFMRKYTGDVMLKTSLIGDTNVVAFATAFSSGQMAVTLVNRHRAPRTVRINATNFGFGEKYYRYTITGEAGQDFSRKSFVNGLGNTGVAGGPENYAQIAAHATLVGNEVRLTLPALSSTFILFENGTNFLPINNDLTSIHQPNKPKPFIIRPNPVRNEFNISNAPPGIKLLEITDVNGRKVFTHTFHNYEDPNRAYSINLPAGVYICVLKGDNLLISSRFVVQ